MGVREKETQQGSYTFTKHTPSAKRMRGTIPNVDPPSNYDDGGPKIGLKRWKKVGYKFNPLLDEVEQPQVMLVNRRLKKICEIINISNFRMTLKELNQANEISFTVYKTLNDIEQPFYDRIADLMVVYVNGEFFEIGITNKEDASIQKNVVGVSLGYAELSQIITSVQINTDEDIERPELNAITKDNYKYGNNTIFYNPVQPSDVDDDQIKWRQLTSMLDRVLSDAPHYQIGTVSETLRNVQRTFSWEDTDIVSILNDIGQEVGCVFDIVVEYDTNGEAVRKVNAYDLCYCKYCWNRVAGLDSESTASGDTYRNVQNGVCMNCKGTIDIYDGHERTGGESIYDIGHNTGIFLSTENLTDDITIDGNKDSVKTTFRITGGDDFMTDTVRGLTPSGNGKITIMPDYIMKNFTKDTYVQYEKYRQANSVAEQPYQQLLEMIYELTDISLYLKSGKMPVFDEPIVDADVAFADAAEDISNNFYNIYYVDKVENYNINATYAIQTSVSKMMKVFLPKGFSVKVQADSVDMTNYKFFGSVTVSSTSNPEDTITVSRNSGGTISITSGKDKRQYAGEYAQTLRSFVERMIFKCGDVDNTTYAEYISRYCASLLSQNDIDYENDKEKDWSQYSYERLKNWYDGYQACIDSVSAMYQQADTDFNRTTLENIITRYSSIQQCIANQMNIIKNQLYVIGMFLGRTKNANGFDSLFLDSEDNLIEYTYYTDHINNSFLDNRFNTDKNAFNSLVNTGSDVFTYGSASYNMTSDIGTYPFKCKACGSTVVKRLLDGTVHCVNCHNTDVDRFITYRSMAQKVVDFYNRFDFWVSSLGADLGSIMGDTVNMKNRLLANGKTLYGVQLSIQQILNIRDNFLNDSQYAELMSYMREQVYSNSNYISEGLTNEEVMQKAKELQEKAKRELSKACQPQYSITASVGSIVALEPYDFLGVDYNVDLANFAINNYVHVRFDDEIYKLRVSSIELTYPMSDKISVSFTNAERYNNGYSSDVASILANAQSMATSFDAVADQSEKGVVANNLFDKIKQAGLDTSLMAVNGGRNQEVLIDDHGILLRELNEYTGDYDPHQTKMINNNIVMTDDNWQSAKLAIGLTLNPIWSEAVARGDMTKANALKNAGQKYLYGVYAGAIVADLVISPHMRRIGNGNGDDCTVDIDENGIKIESGWFDVGKDGNRVIIDPAHMSPKNQSNGQGAWKMISGTTSSKGEVFYITSDGSAHFEGDVYANSGYIGGWTIKNEKLCNERNVNATIYTGTTNANWREADGSSSNTGFHLSKNGLHIGSNFSVDEYGKLHAYQGVFDGQIEAKSGHIYGGVTIDGDVLINSNASIRGKVIATSGKIGALTIGEDGSIYSDTVYGLKRFEISPFGDVRVEKLVIDPYGPDSIGFSFTHDAAAISFDVVQGIYASDNQGFKPLQLEVVGVDTKGRKLRGEGENGAYVGIWQRGRMIIGDTDYGNPFSDNTLAFKTSIDGSLFVRKDFYCCFGSDNVYKIKVENGFLKVTSTSPKNVIGTKVLK